jgi:(1->4)-alpha-D-glucan 1-alpha-D-glucosylmutase
LIDLVGAILTLDLRGEAESEFVYRLQQVTGPVMAKGIEDTAFYRYHRLVSRCEVGADPGLFAMSIDEFHARQAAAADRHPHRMVATSTHDTKRSEDARARLAVLAEVTDEWANAVAGWRRHTDRYLSETGPDLHDQYAFFQNLVAAWPASPDRMLKFMSKATREARRRTSWRNPDPVYDRAVRSFVEGAMVDHEFLGWVEKFVAWINPAARRTALAQKLLALTVPGVPDLYRGSEVWYHALVDPDNRRPVDFARLRNLAERVRSIEADRLGDLADDSEGAAKAWLVQRVLGIRKERAASFAGPYTPLRVEGPGADRVIAFRRGEDVAVVVIAPPYLRAPMPSGVFELPPGRWVDRFGDADPVAGFVSVESALHVIPGTVLTRVD